MKWHPILFQADMVRAVLDGRKTQTRRVIKPPPGPNDIFTGWLANTAVWRELGQLYGVTRKDMQRKCPYGVPGDRLWVREKWQKIHSEADIFYYADESFTRHIDQEPWFESDWAKPKPRHYARPSIHMPRWASRLSLEVVTVRVERVQEISEEDAWHEGVDTRSEYAELAVRLHGDKGSITACDYFHELWDSINGKNPGRSWADNPWVWCVSFRRVE